MREIAFYDEEDEVLLDYLDIVAKNQGFKEGFISLKLSEIYRPTLQKAYLNDIAQFRPQKTLLFRWIELIPLIFLKQFLDDELDELVLLNILIVRHIFNVNQTVLIITYTNRNKVL